MKTKAQVSAYNKARYKANPKRFKDEAKMWQRSHPRKFKQYRKKNAIKIRARVSAWCKENSERRKAYKAKRRTAKTKAGGVFTSAQWIALCNKYHNRCASCGRKRKLTVDHVVPVSKGGTSNISNIQPLCLPCNSHKGTKTIDYR